MKSRINWITLGDKNTKCFQQNTIIRRKRNNFLYLTREDGSLTWDTVEISNTILHYFKNIYSYSSHVVYHPPFIHGIPNLSAIDLTKLTYPSSELEIRNAFFDLHPLKTPGDDGLHAIFYQKNWNLVKNHLIIIFKNIFTSWNIPNSWGDTLLCLIPKINKKIPPNPHILDLLVYI